MVSGKSRATKIPSLDAWHEPRAKRLIDYVSIVPGAAFLLTRQRSTPPAI